MVMRPCRENTSPRGTQVSLAQLTSHRQTWGTLWVFSGLDLAVLMSASLSPQLVSNPFPLKESICLCGSRACPVTCLTVLNPFPLSLLSPCGHVWTTPPRLWHICLVAEPILRAPPVLPSNMLEMKVSNQHEGLTPEWFNSMCK